MSELLFKTISSLARFCAALTIGTQMAFTIHLAAEPVDPHAVHTIRPTIEGTTQLHIEEALISAVRDTAVPSPALIDRAKRVGEALQQIAASSQGTGLLVIEGEVLSRRVDLEEFTARVPAELAGRILFFGKDNTPALKAAARSGIRVINSENIEALALAIRATPKASWVGFVGDPLHAVTLSALLPATVQVTRLESNATLAQLFLVLGVPRLALDRINGSLLRDDLVALHSA